MPLGLIEKLEPSKNENMVDHILWMGGFDFRTCPFTDADALVLCQLAYFDMKMLFDGKREKVRVKDLLPYIENGESKPLLTGPDGGSSDIAKAACLSRRYGELIIRNHEDVLQHDPPLQFAAMTFHDGNNLNFLAFRGTDSSLAGWKEDFMIAFTETEAQRMAAEYAGRVITPDKAWIMGGHSKGGNQVLYAAAHLNFTELACVRRIYMLDGPGFCPEILGKKEIGWIEPKVTRVIPEFDMIGKLFEPDISDTRIIRSANPEGLGQHALASWLVDHGGLSRGKASMRAERMMKVVGEWIADMSMEERKTFVNELFEAFGVDGTTDLNQITAERFGDILIGLNKTSAVTKKIFSELPKRFLKESIQRITK